MVFRESASRTVSANGRRGTDQPNIQVSPDTLLQISRRLDWRFLLPDPTLGQVAYIGPARGTLLASLGLLSTSLTVVERIDQQDIERSGRHDVVVVSNPDAAKLRQAVELLRPGGWIYMEAYSPFSRRRLRRRLRWPRFAGDYTQLLRRLDVEEVAVHWHWPDFESCTKILPLDDRAAFLHVFVRGRSGLVAQLKAVLGDWLLRSGLLPRLIPCFSVVARRGEA